MTTDVKELKQALVSGEVARATTAAEQLAQLGEAAQPAAVELAIASAAAPPLRDWASAALEELGPPTTQDLPRLIPLLADASADVGYWAATLLGRLGEDGAPAVAGLIAALSDSPHATVRERAALALGKIGAGASAAAPALTEAAAGGNARLATLARDALANIQA